MDERVANTPNPGGYALNGKIMLSAIIILFLVVVLMVALHMYARWHILRRRRRQLLRRRRNSVRRAHVVFYVDNINTGAANSVPENQGLEQAVLGSLPVFVYSSKTRPEGLECAVCLSEFEENEMGRVLPKCNHSFHIECIDMWFQSHSTCPICRAAVEPVVLPRNRAAVGLAAGSSSEEEGSSSMPAPLGCRRKGLDLTGVTIEIPTRGSLEDELPLSSPANLAFRSPGSRLLSLKRILSMGRRTPTGSSAATQSGAGTSCAAANSAAEPDLESGPAELTRVPTPK